MPFDGFISHWEPEPEHHPLQGCFTVSAYRGPKGGRGPYKHRWLVTQMRNGIWTPAFSVLGKSRANATGTASANFYLKRVLGAP